jgi:hypothetical protein
MHWDFFTVLSVLSGIVLLGAGLAGPVVGTARERLGIAALGAFSFAYGIWVATQTSGYYLFSIAPAALAVTIIFRAFQHAATSRAPVSEAGRTPGAAARTASARPAVSALQAAQPERIRRVVTGKSSAFCPVFQLPGPAEASSSNDHPSESVAFAWSTPDDRPRLMPGEELLGIWKTNARIKVAIDKDMNPTPPNHDLTWVTVVDGIGLIALSGFRLIGIVVRGDSLVGAFSDSGKVMWSLPLGRLGSVSVTRVGMGEGLILSSAELAGLVTLTSISVAEISGYQTAGVTPEHVAELISLTRARLSAD